MIDESMKKEWTKEFVEYTHSLFHGIRFNYTNTEYLTEANYKIQGKIKELCDKGCPKFVVQLTMENHVIRVDIQGVQTDDENTIPLDLWLSPESLEEISVVMSK